jgi:hypothetical protein
MYLFLSFQTGSVSHFVLVDIPNSDGTVGETTEQSGTAGVPLEGGALLKEGLLVLSHGDVLGSLMLETLEWFEVLVLEVPDEDSPVSGSGQPLVFWVELEIVDLRLGLVDNRGLLEGVDVPDFDLVVFSTGGDVLSSWGNREGVDGLVMSFKGVFDLEVLVPDLEISIPTSSSEVLHLLRWGISDTRDPVLMVVLLNGVLALTFDIPKLDVLLAATRENDSVVWVEAAREHFLFMADELVSDLTFSKVPKSKGAIPRGGESELVLA